MSLLDELLKKLQGALQTPGAVPGVPQVVPQVSMNLGSGYSVAADRAANVAKLLAACDAAVLNPMWRPNQPWPLATHCNGAAQQIAGAMGCHDLDGLLANQQVIRMQTTPGWRVDTPERAVAHACAGGLAFAAMSSAPHGHIAAIRPEPMELSGTWGCLVPIVANVGRDNKRCKLSGAFLLADRPKVVFYLWGTV